MQRHATMASAEEVRGGFLQPRDVGSRTAVASDNCYQVSWMW
jgi:hypothetical protein